MLALQSLLKEGKQIDISLGERLARPDEFTPFIYCLQSGSMRLLFSSQTNQGILTLRRLEPGEWIGWSNLLNGEPCEWVTAASDASVLAIPAEQAAHCLWSNKELMNEVLSLPHPQLGCNAIVNWLNQQSSQVHEPDHLIKELATKGKIQRFDKLKTNNSCNDESVSHLTANLALGQPGRLVDDQTVIKGDSSISAPALIWSVPTQLLDVSTNIIHKDDLSNSLVSEPVVVVSRPEGNETSDSQAPDAYSLGIRNDSTARLSERYPECCGRGELGKQLAVLEMVAKVYKLPFRRDQLKKKLLLITKKGHQINLQTLAKLCVGMGLDARPAEIESQNIRKIKPPFLLIKENQPILVHDIRGNKVITGDGNRSLQKQDLSVLTDSKESFGFVAIRRASASATDRFNWAWVWGIVRNYRGSLLLVVVVSLMAQLFALGVPLLLQQLIDKVLTQGNVSSLNALAGLMIAFALFQSVLTALRMFLFVDTTDRIDLTLGSSIIDRLLRLPLGFFEKRPVGELSQRIGEMNNIRNFLTGTAITTFLDLVFSSIYLVVMLSYSPGLTAVALCTFPFYLGITFFAAPIYRQQLRKRAIAQAETQAHLIESLSGIQTIKAQHGELRARWKWQQRYQRFVEQGYKSVVLGTTTGQIGGFLNTLSSLLILWFGLGMVLKGEFTLGQLLAFRIFAGYVTAPLLRISNLWQGIQKVNLSMERLADIVNQTTEAGDYDDEQIALPPINGAVRVDNLDFSFNSSKNLQLSDVSFSIEPGEFIGVVGLSGSGKSTLMKLMARLYPPKSGRILIDDVDIGKVQLSSLRSQVGLVPQDSVLFEGSVADNIALNDPNIDTEDIVAAAKLACAHDFIMELPQGYATRVAEKGANFSGGQRQRLAIARMLIESPSLLIMDEATSALDADTERKVSRNLMQAMNGKTVFFVTHRMATIMKADRVIVMDKGRVAELGSPKELIEQNGIFAALWNQQR